MHFLYKKLNKVLTTRLCTLEYLAVLNHSYACSPFSECIQNVYKFSVIIPEKKSPWCMMSRLFDAF